jgi:hypothetical protein
VLVNRKGHGRRVDRSNRQGSRETCRATHGDSDHGECENCAPAPSEGRNVRRPGASGYGVSSERTSLSVR